MTLPAPKSAADCLQYLHLQPHEQAITEARIEEYAVAMARAAAVAAIRECGTIVQRIFHKPMTEDEVGNDRDLPA